MNKTILAIIGVLIIGGGAFFALKNNNSENNSPAKVEGNVINTAWVEVERGTLFLKLPGQAKELKSGDIIESGASLETGKNSSTIVHFPDGSILSMDKETSITIPQIEVNDESKGILIKITLTVGRVWSKVISLATPESVWEVKTSNTVATVRGTAFGMGVKGTTSWVNTSENKVAVSPLDPETKEKIADAEIIVEEKKYVEINNVDVNNIKKEQTATTTESGVIENPRKTFLTKKLADVPSLIVDDSWVKQVKEKHKEVDAEVKSIEERIKNRESELKDRVMELTEEKRKAFLEGKRLDVKKTIERITDKENDTTYERKEEVRTESTEETKTPEIKTETATTERAPEINWEKVVITTSDRLVVDEGSTIQFKAYAMRENERVDVTDMVSWQVIGFIGSITKPGVFVAKLGDQVSELGKGIGRIAVTKKGEREVLGTSGEITVSAVAISTPLDIGGQ